MSIKSVLLALASVLVLTATAVAGERAGAFSISPFGGGYTFDGSQHQETAPVYGLRLGYDFTKVFGVEAVGDFLSTEGTRTDTSINALSYRLDFLFNLMPEGPVVPYLALGGGGITLGHGGSFDAGGRNTNPTGNGGIGLKLFLNDSVALRADARQLFIFPRDGSVMYNWEYTAGVTFLFGGETRSTR